MAPPPFPQSANTCDAAAIFAGRVSAAPGVVDAGPHGSCSPPLPWAPCCGRAEGLQNPGARGPGRPAGRGASREL
ncbi:hypothetical protein chiPu_0026522 [Chiloscyllium punctatum]|uniref:Uncharacterized protein n=1 Tax=Chiloscyllium punctatum TaxID=137246 RepID=A0A401TIZ5_CHIPU|nr:hypothetical protein [Chiloscyllium punctatum]